MVIVGNYRNRAELRKKPRRHFHYTAKIIVDDAMPPLSGSISDISEFGAWIVLEREVELPETFWLLLTTNGQARRHCRTVWRTGPNLGVEFPQEQ